MTELTDGPLDGKAVLISGGTQGLGAGVAIARARNGADIAVTGRRQDVGEKFVSGLEETGTRARYIPADAADVAQGVAAVAVTVDRSGRLPGQQRRVDYPRHPARHHAPSSTQGIPYIAQAGDAETATTTLTLSGGTIAVVSNTRANGRGHDVRLELLSSEDSVAAGLDQRLPLRSADPEVTFPAEEPWEFFMDRLADAFRAELTVFTEVMAGTRTSPCTVADAVEAALIAEAATVSFPEHRPVRIEEIR